MRTSLRPFLIATGVLGLGMGAASGLAFNYTFTTIAGNPAMPRSYADGTNSNALFFGDMGLTVDSSGNVYVADQYNQVIRKATPVGTNWVVTTIAGNPGQVPFFVPLVDGTNSQALFCYPTGVAVDADTNIYVADQVDNAIRKITPLPGTTNWVVKTIAGQGKGTYGSTDGMSSVATFFEPTGVAMDANSNLFVTDLGNSTIRKITPVPGTTNWVVTTIAGLAKNTGNANGVGTNASFFYPAGIAVDLAGNVYVADSSNNIIRKVAPVTGTTNWIVSTIAGNPFKHGSVDGTNAEFNEPTGLASDTNGTLYVADLANSTIRRIAPSGSNWVVSTIGGQAQTTNWVNGLGTNALFYGPAGMAVDAAGNIYVADTGNGTLRLGSPPGNPELTMMTVSGTAAQFTLSGQAGGECVIQVSTNLLTWSPLLTNTISSGGSLLIEDPAPATNSFRFYRGMMP